LRQSRKAMVLEEIKTAWPWMLAGAVFFWWITRPVEEKLNEGNCAVMDYDNKFPGGPKCIIEDLDRYADQQPWKFPKHTLVKYEQSEGK
jgi:hypothetical protein